MGIENKKSETRIKAIETDYGIQISLGICGYTVHSDTLTHLLELQLSRIWVHREVHRGHTVRYVRRLEYIFLPRSVIAATKLEDVEKYFEALLDLLEPHTESILSLSKIYHAHIGLECEFFLAECAYNPELYLQPELIQRISALGLYFKLSFLSEGADDENNETQVYFAAHNYDVAPETITKLMQREPSRVCITGEPIPGMPQQAVPILSRKNSWQLKSDLSFVEEIPRHLEHFLPQLLPHLEAISALKNVYHADTWIGCSTSYYQERATLYFSPEIMHDLSILKLPVWLDFYFLGGADSDTPDKPKSQRKSDWYDDFCVAFEAYHDTLTSKAITDILGLKPTRKQRHHPRLTDSKPTARDRDQNCWVLQSALLNNVVPETKIMALLQIMEPRAAAFQQFKQDHAGHLNLRCALCYRDNPAHLHLTQDMLQSLGKLGCSLELNMGFSGRHPLSHETTQIVMTGPYATEAVFQTEYHIGNDEAQAQVWFTCFDHDSTSDPWTEKIPLSPSASQHIGQPMPHDPESRFAQNSWTLYSPLYISAPVEKQIQALLELLTPHAEALQAIQQQGDTEMGIHCLIYASDHLMELVPELVCALAQLGLYLNLEFHQLK